MRRDVSLYERNAVHELKDLIARLTLTDEEKKALNQATERKYVCERNSLRNIAKKNGIAYHTLYHRVKKGLSIEEALAWQPFRSICDNHDLEYHAVYMRVNQYGWSLDRALNTPIRGRG